MQATVQDVQVRLLLASRPYGSRRGYLTETIASCGYAEVAVELVHGELVQNVAGHGARRLIADASTINADAVDSSLFRLTPDWLSKIDLMSRDVDVTARPDEEDLSRRSRVDLSYIDSDNRGEAVSNIGDIRMIDVRNPHHHWASVNHVLGKDNRASAIDWLCRYQVSVVSN